MRTIRRESSASGAIGWMYGFPVLSTSLFLICLAIVSCRPQKPVESEPPPGEAWMKEEAIRIEASPGRGVYEEAQQVRLLLTGESSGVDDGGQGTLGPSDLDALEIRYTLDGSAPTADSGEVYRDTIPLQANTMLRAAAFADGNMVTTIATHSYLFPAATLAQADEPDDPPGLPEHWGHGTIVDADYGMDPRVFEAPGAREDALRSLAELPTVSLVLAPTALFGAETGIYANPLQRGREWERAVSVELIDPKGNEPGFQVDAGLRIHGNLSRHPSESPKHSLRLKFRSEYGPSKLDYPLFTESPVDRFNSLVLRAIVNDSFLVDGEKAQYLRGAWLRETERHMGLRTAQGRFVHLYIAGLYWGLYELAERLDEDFAADYWGGEPEEYDVLTPDGVNSGTADAWEETLRMAEAGLESREAYEAIAERVDIVAFIDHWILGQYAARTVWPIANWSAIGQRAPEGRFRFPAWDGEHAMLDIHLDRSTSAKAGTPAQLYSRLRRNSEFQRLFGDRVQKHFFEGGLLYADPSLAAWDPTQADRNAPATRYAAWAERIENAVLLESARWGDWEEPEARPFDRDRDWIPARDFILGSFFTQRRQVVLEQFRKRGLYSEIEPPRLFVAENGGLRASNDLGEVYCAPFGVDPREPWTGAVSKNASLHSSEKGLRYQWDQPQHLRCRTKLDEDWSADIAFRTTNPPLQISELMYHPADDGDAEFIEIANAGAEPIHLGGFRLSGGIDYRFSEGLVLEPRGKAVLVSSRRAFSERYPEIRAFGRYVGRLSNAGERIELRASDGALIEALVYSDEAPWPSEPDGNGASLERELDFGSIPLEEAQDPRYWRISGTTGGSPGR